MKKSNVITVSHPMVTIGLDLGDRRSHFCVLNERGECSQRGDVPTSAEALEIFFLQHVGELLIMEVGGHSPWVSRLAEQTGLDVVVANPRKVALITKNERKNDRTDAELLARLGRVDRRLLSPVQHRSSESQAHLVMLRTRTAIVKSRAALINHVRGAVKSFGGRIKLCSTSGFHNQATEQIPRELSPALLPIVRLIEELSSQVKDFDKKIEQLSLDRYPQTQTMRQVTGVGSLISTSFALTIADPARFEHDRDVGPYLGMTPETKTSGDSDPQMRITKCGDRQMRALLVVGANYILGRFGPDCDLKRFGLKIAARGGKNARKRAKVAVARKLAVLMLRLWRTGEVYDPFYLAKRRGEAVPT
jgi:transposase